MKRSRSSHVRVKVVALLMSLVALWGFAAFVTLREGVNLLSVSTLDTQVGRPSEALVAALQQERRLSVVFLANRASDARQAMIAQRASTNEARDAFKRLAGGDAARGSASAALNSRISEVIAGLDGLSRVRDTIDSGVLDRAQAATSFTDVVTSTFRVYSALSTLDDPQIAKEGRTLIALSRAREVLSQEDALLAGVVTVGRFATGEHEQFIRLAGAQRLLYDDAAAELPPPDQARYQHLVTGSAYLRFRTVEDAVIDRGRAGAPAPVDAATWKAAVDPVFTELRDLVLAAADGTLRRAKPAVIGVLVRLGLAGGLGLLAVIASIVVSITTARSLIRQLERLRTAALELSNERLPRVVDRLRRGEVVNVDAEAPPLTFGTDEIGQLGEAFNTVQRTAVEVAVEQAELRRGVRDVFLSIARRTQAQVHRQLAMLDAMERQETGPEELAALFRVDHLATRMRRNAENLIVLSGATAGRGWRNPVPMVDVIRGAVGEVEDYARVTVLPIGPAGLAGRAVGDVIHLLAELVENATSFSPPETPVQVGGQRVANGFVVEIEDRGLGMPEADLAKANDQLRDPPEFRLSGSIRLGLYVVGRLAQRHGIRVELRASPYGGTMAIVLIPMTVIEDDTVATHALGPARRGASVDDDDEPTTGNTARTSRRLAANLLVGGSRPQTRKAAEILALTPSSPPRLVAAPTPSSQPLAVRRGPSAVPLNGVPASANPASADPANAEPASAEPPGSARAELVATDPATTAVTPNGLPRRVRRPDTAPPLPDPAPLLDDAPAREPEETRRMLSKYQHETARGRSAAEQTSVTEAGRDDERVDTGTGNTLVDR